ncbi:tyrosine-type recombinase/integrase [Lutibacter sp.]|uniref:tyrosine-type recombinase/integrase n=1 Tax=Lutibacter sp. TaxID=1925666 RepID=UPI0034A0A08B
MKKDTKLQKVSNEILGIIKKNQFNPAQVRYIFKLVRQKGGYQVPKVPKALPNYLSPAEIYQLLQVTEDSFDHLLIEFLLKTGLRISEARNIMIQDIDFSMQQINVRKGKNSKDRTVTLHHSLVNTLRMYINDRKGYLFVKKDGLRYSVRALQYRISKNIEKLGSSKKLNTHSLRHTFATYLRLQGMPLQDIQVILGHSTIKTTEIYAKMVQSVESREKFQQIMGF